MFRRVPDYLYDDILCRRIHPTDQEQADNMGFSHIDHFGLKPIRFLFYFIPLVKAKQQKIVLYKNQHVFELKIKKPP